MSWINIKIVCRLCSVEYHLKVRAEDFDNWKNRGVLIQHAMPYLIPSQRELLQSQTCDSCWEELFTDDATIH